MKMRCKFSKTMAQGEKIPMFQNNAYFLSSIVSLGYCLHIRPFAPLRILDAEHKT